MDSSDSATLINIPSPHPSDLALPPPPSDLTHDYCWEKLPSLQILSEIRAQKLEASWGKHYGFGAHQLALLALVNQETLDSMKDAPEKLDAICESAKPLTTFFVTGICPVNESLPKESSPKNTPPKENELDSTAGDARRDTSTCSLVRRLLHIVGRLYRSADSPEERPRVDTLTEPPNPHPRKRRRTSSSEPESSRSMRLKASNCKDCAEPPSHLAHADRRFMDRLRDVSVCIWTQSKGGIKQVPIIPLAVSSSARAADFWDRIADPLIIIFGDAFAGEIKTILHKRYSIYEPWNVLTLSLYLEWLYNAGLVAFWPITVAFSQSEPYSQWEVRFSIHWLGKTETKLADTICLSPPSLHEMSIVRPDFRSNAGRYDIFDAVTGERIADGAERTVLFETQEMAQHMYDCLTLSWTMRVVLFLAGGSGTPDGDISKDEYFRERDRFGLLNSIDDRRLLCETCGHGTDDETMDEYYDRTPGRYLRIDWAREREEAYWEEYDRRRREPDSDSDT